MGSDLRFIKLALQLAKRGVGQTGLNPSVGCVIVKNNKIVGRGVTGPGGYPHAEVLALEQAGGECEGATLFVTLEPCSHYGRTPPCADAILKSKISRVVCPLLDPDPRVSGKGFNLIQQANIELDFIPSASAWAEEVAKGFISRITRGIPYVTVKLGMSLDGKIASKTGKSQWITNAAARNRSHLIRVQNDAIMVGTNTFMNDNPKLNVRGSLTGLASPLRVFLDKDLKIYPSKDVVENVLKYGSIIVCGEKPRLDHLKIWQRNKIEILQIKELNKKLNLKKLFELLAKRGINALLIEGGGTLVKSLLVEGLIDTLIIHTSGIVIGSDGVSSFAALQKIEQEISAFPKMTLKTINQYEDNLETIWKPN